MIQFALNHMTVARMSFRDLVALAKQLGCVGIEVRNDLPQPLFDGMEPAAGGALVRENGLRLLAVAEVKRFNDWSSDREAEALALIRIARAAGAEAVSLIPRNDNLGMGNGERQANLRVALKALKPMLEDHDLVGMVEPLGFETCALRYKAETVEGIEAVGGRGRFKLVHDTFHHTLAHGGPLFPDHTGIVHVSGVVDQQVGISEMRDPHRVLVTPGDRLGNLDQITALQAAGWVGPVSFEAFSAEVHALADPASALRSSMDHIANVHA
ncbi:TIM barrel protein [Rhodobacter calidifons]|uniref:TIM barrel protein n=1 Tax=Rhodobacter calidifons TaxID=2715277 RepID=A0ABX0G3F7_9RHOB|nr:TIM barrel protein [Rhodobacter calidifons]NHB75649.1 TIM barrel protein [Rhodobacter calidifons]